MLGAESLPALYWPPFQSTSTGNEATPVFQQLDLYPGLRKTLEDLGLDTATDVQAATVTAALEGKDLLVGARTGTGKTLAYLVPTIHALASDTLPRHPGTLALILAPTRELARQVARQAEQLTSRTPLNTLLLTGGEPFKIQVAELRKAPEIVVATPGRLLELMEKQAVDLSVLRVLVVDEADRVLEMGFGQDIETIAGAANPERQTLLLSATLGRTGMGALEKTLLRDPLRIDLSAEQAQTIRHCVMLADDRSHKNEELVWLLRNQPFRRALVFANTRENAERLFTLARAQNLEAGVLHGEKSHDARKAIMERFSHGRMNILIASDVAARGLDIPDVELVINVDLPRRGDDYTHRVGRTGRMGSEGVAISLVEPGEWNRMIDIQRYLKLTFERMEVEALLGKFRGPKQTRKSGKTVGKKKRKKAVEKPGTKRKTPARKSSAKKPAKRKQSPITGEETLRKKR